MTYRKWTFHFDVKQKIKKKEKTTTYTMNKLKSKRNETSNLRLFTENIEENSISCSNKKGQIKKEMDFQLINVKSVKKNYSYRPIDSINHQFSRKKKGK